MSTRVDDAFTLGETWTEVITCTAPDGAAVNPVTASWKLNALDGSTVVQKTEASGIVIAGNVCTVTVPTGDQVAVSSRTYWRRLKITDGDGAISRQVHGFITVLPDD